MGRFMTKQTRDNPRYKVMFVGPCELPRVLCHRKTNIRNAQLPLLARTAATYLLDIGAGVGSHATGWGIQEVYRKAAGVHVVPSTPVQLWP